MADVDAWGTYSRHAASAARAHSQHKRGWDIGKVVTVNADNTYGLSILARSNADGGAAHYPAVGCANARAVFVLGDYVNVSRQQGDADKIEITGMAQFLGPSEPTTVVHNVS